MLFYQWVNSAGHLKNMMNNTYTEIGIGVAWAEGNDNVYATQQFSKPYFGEATTTADKALPSVLVKSSDDREVVSLVMKTMPTKTSYLEGQEIAVNGGSIEVTYEDKETEIIPLTKDMLSEYDNTKLGTQLVTVTYKAKSTSFPVSVEENTIVLVKSNQNDSYAFHILINGNTIPEEAMDNITWNSEVLGGFAKDVEYITIQEKRVTLHKSVVIKVTATYKGTSVTKVLIKAGDIDENGEVNEVDLARICDYIDSNQTNEEALGNSGYGEYLADFNSDGKVDEMDLAILNDSMK
jgi:hypothetical protein